MIVSWFSAGVSSAVATKIALNKYGNVKIIYTHIDDQHEDTMRFIKDCQEWFGVPVEINQSELKNVENACRKSGFINSPRGAACTRLLKRRVRQIWEMENEDDYSYVWGFDLTEKDRSERLLLSMPDNEHVFPLIDGNIDKAAAHGILEAAGIKRPAMYDMGYPNNNCVGCLKGGMGYWNKIRADFPEIFTARCELENIIGGRVFNDFNLCDLPEDRGRRMPVIVPNCGLFCDID